MLSPLRNKDYAKLFSAQGIALIGTGLTTVALALLAFDLAGDQAGEVLGIALGIKMVAYVTLAPLAGALAQAFSRKPYLIVLDLVRAAIVLCLPFVTEVWQIFMLIFAMQACSAGFSPVFQATISDILEDEATYTKALSLSRLAYDVETFVSPVLAGTALLLVSFDALFAANACAFLTSAWLIMRTRMPDPTPHAAPTRVIDNITFGLRAYLATPRLRGLFAFSMTVAAAGSMVIINTVVVVQAALELSETWTAILLSLFGLGSMAGALILPRILARIGDRQVCTSAACAMISVLGLGTMATGFAAMAAIWFVIGAGYSAILVCAGRLLNQSSTKPDRPAYFAAQFALSHACWLVTYPLAGWLGGNFGLPVTFAILAGVATLAFALGIFLWPAQDANVLDHHHPVMDHEHMHIHDEHHQHAHEGWEGPEPHCHDHHHAAIRHNHRFSIDLHHPAWPR